jgi:hypothetical protein
MPEEQGDQSYNRWMVLKKTRSRELHGELWCSSRLELSYSTNKLQDWKPFGAN